MNKKEAVETLGKIQLGIPSHPHLKVCDSVPMVIEAHKIVKESIEELDGIVQRIDDKIFYLEQNITYGIGNKEENERQIYILNYIKTGEMKK